MFLDRFYYRAYIYYRRTLSYTGQQEFESEVSPSIMLSLFLAAWALAILLISDYFGFIAFGQGMLSPSNTSIEVYVMSFAVLFMFVVHMYFISSGRWKKILKSHGSGGSNYCRGCDRVVDLFCVLPFVLTIIFTFIG